MDVDPDDLRTANLVYFIGWRFRTSHVLAQTIKQELFAIQAEGIIKGLGKIDFTNNPEVMWILRAVRRETGVGKSTTKPILNELLIKMLKRLPTTCYEGIMFRTALTMAKFLCLRPSEYLAIAKYNKYDNPLQLKYITKLYRKGKLYGYKVDIRYSKSNQFGLHEFIAMVCTCHVGVCGVHELERFLKIRKDKTPNSRLFVYPNGSNLTRYTLVNVIKNLMYVLKGTDKGYRLYSLRKGGVTEMTLNGIEDSIIRRMARHARNSKALFRYQVLSAEQIANLAYYK